MNSNSRGSNVSLSSEDNTNTIIESCWVAVAGGGPFFERCTRKTNYKERQIDIQDVKVGPHRVPIYGSMPPRAAAHAIIDDTEDQDSTDASRR